MLKFLIFISIVAGSLGATKRTMNARIIGGKEANIRDHPYIVSMRYDGEHICGGTIIDMSTVLTAAHCCDGMNKTLISVGAGSSYWNSSKVVVQVKSLKMHPKFSRRSMNNDACIIKLETNLTLTSDIQAAPLRTVPPASGTIVEICGWGTLASGSHVMSAELRCANVTVISNADCMKTLYGKKIRNNMICAADTGKDSCKGDSGGPVVFNGALAMIVSWGNGCDVPNYPGVYADISQLRSWITPLSSGATWI